MTVPFDFGFTDEHRLLQQQARRFLSERGGADARRALLDDALGHDPAVFAAMAELGWAGLVLPEAHGGAELGWLAQVLLLEEQGRALVPSPLLATTLCGVAVDLAADDAQKAALLPGLAAGGTLGAVAWSEPDVSWEPEALTATATANGDGFVLSGTKTHVVSGATASLLVAPFLLEGELAVFAVPLPAEGATVGPEVSLDLTRRTARVVLDGVRVPASARLARGDLAAWRALHLRGRLAVAAELVGATEAVLLTTRDYANVRTQFGKPIGSFQAVKHPLVDTMIGCETARSLVYEAAAAVAAGDPSADTVTRMAKAAASDAAAFAVRKGVQLHGGMGFTFECDLHFFFRRAMWGRASLGDAGHHRRHLAERLGALSG